MARYECKAVSLRTGRVLSTPLPLTAVSAQRRLDHGNFSATLRLPTAAPSGVQRKTDLAICRDLIAATTPNVMSVIVVRDGRIMGEWWITTRDRQNNPPTITGREVGYWFHRAAVDGFTTMTNADQLDVAVALADNALAKPFAPPITVEAPGLSGNVIDKAEHLTGTAYVGDILTEYASALDGFDWWVDTDWDNTATVPTVKRTLRFGYPRRGRLLPGRIDVPARTVGQSGVKYGVAEDGAQVSTTVYMTGTGEGDTQLVSRGQNNDLYSAYPSLDLIDSRADYGSQQLLDAAAAATAATARTPEVPNSVRVRADGDLTVGLYAPGDSVPLSMEPWECFPDGYAATVRIVGFTLMPPQDGATEMVDLEITRDDAGAFGS